MISKSCCFAGKLCVVKAAREFRVEFAIGGLPAFLRACALVTYVIVASWCVEVVARWRLNVDDSGNVNWVHGWSICADLVSRERASVQSK